MKSVLSASVLVMLGFLVLVAPAFGQVEESVRAFDEGNQLYKDGRYEEAIVAYERARVLGYTSGLLNYNLGNAYYRNDQLGQAIRFYEKAKILLPDSEELNHNLAIANSRTRDQFSELPTPAWASWWQGLVAKNGAGPLFYGGLFVYLVAIGLFAHWVRTRTTNPWHRRGRTVASVLAAILLCMSFFASSQSGKYTQAVVVVEEIQLWEQPSQEGTEVMLIHEGLVLDLVQQQAEWAEVRLPNGTRGWVNVSALAEV